MSLSTIHYLQQQNVYGTCRHEGRRVDAFVESTHQHDNESTNTVTQDTEVSICLLVDHIEQVSQQIVSYTYDLLLLCHGYSAFNKC